MADRMTVTAEGMAEQRAVLLHLRAWLEAQGFTTGENLYANAGNLCDWYAWRRSALPARECELNDGKRAQIVITPHLYELRDRRYLGIEVTHSGQHGDWFQLKAYSLGPEDLIARLPEIEAKLVRAWNALEEKSDA